MSNHSIKSRVWAKDRLHRCDEAVREIAWQGSRGIRSNRDALVLITFQAHHCRRIRTITAKYAPQSQHRTRHQCRNSWMRRNSNLTTWWKNARKSSQIWSVRSDRPDRPRITSLFPKATRQGNWLAGRRRKNGKHRSTGTHPWLKCSMIINYRRKWKIYSILRRCRARTKRKNSRPSSQHCLKTKTLQKTMEQSPNKMPCQAARLQGVARFWCQATLMRKTTMISARWS